MQRSESLDRETVPHYGPNHSISAIFFLSQPIAMVNPRIPSGDVAAPRTDVIFDADVLAENLIAPAVMVAGNEEDWQSCIAQIRKRCKSTKAVSGYHRFPFEPEVEQISVDHQRTRVSCKSSQECNELSLDVERGDAKVRVGDYVAR